MSTAKMALGTRTLLADSSINSLASATYLLCGTITWASSSKVPITSKLEVAITSSTASSYRQVAVYAKPSMDGTNFGTGPESGTSTAGEADMVLVGYVPCLEAALHRVVFDLAWAFGGYLPHSAKIILKNETGGALSASGHSVHYTDYVGDVV